MRRAAAVALLAVTAALPLAPGRSAAALERTPVGIGVTIAIHPRSATRGCVRGPAPDRRCSPGAYYVGLVKAVICGAGFRTSAIRNVGQAEKYAVEREYGMAARLYGHTIEIDHIIPLELGGSNAIGNLFPEPGRAGASYHGKDQLENRLKVLVCSNRIGLRAARVGIATDWRTLYRRVFDVAPIP